MSFSLVGATQRHDLPGRALIMRHSSIGFLLLLFGAILDRERRAKNCVWS